MKGKGSILLAAFLLTACDKKLPEQASGKGAATPGKSASPSPVSAAGDGVDEPEKEAKRGTRTERAKKPPVGTAAAGQPGKVVSPFSGEAVDIGNHFPGSVVQDPKFPDDPSKQFVVPDDVEKPVYAEAQPVPGKPGVVFSPYSNQMIDVTDMPEGSLARDPGFPSSENKIFRIPKGSGNRTDPPADLARPLSDPPDGD